MQKIRTGQEEEKKLLNTINTTFTTAVWLAARRSHLCWLPSYAKQKKLPKWEWNIILILLHMGDTCNAKGSLGYMQTHFNSFLRSVGSMSLGVDHAPHKIFPFGSWLCQDACRMQLHIWHHSLMWSNHSLFGLHRTPVSSVMPNTICFISHVLFIRQMCPNKFIFLSITVWIVQSRTETILGAVPCQSSKGPMNPDLIHQTKLLMTVFHQVMHLCDM